MGVGDAGTPGSAPGDIMTPNESGIMGLRAPDWPGLLERYGELLPIDAETPRLGLGEGGTPLVRADRLAAWAGVAELYLKVEGLNPTGSFKDRGMVVAVARAVQAGARAMVCASTGNTAASAAAYAARAGLRCFVLLPRGGVASGKLAQVAAHGAEVLEVPGSFDVTLDLARGVADRYPVVLVNSVNPDRIEGQATAAYEVVDALGGAPDVLALPVGNGGNITAYWRGFRRYGERRGLGRLPRLIGAQAAGAAPLVEGRPVAEPRTVASAIRIGRPATWDPALDAARESGGRILAVDDDRILEAQAAAARREGVFCEPGSAAALAGLRAAREEGAVPAASRCVVVLTGHGLKDPERAAAALDARAVPGDVDGVAAAMGLANAGA